MCGQNICGPEGNTVLVGKMVSGSDFLLGVLHVGQFPRVVRCVEDVIVMFPNFPTHVQDCQQIFAPNEHLSFCGGWTVDAARCVLGVSPECVCASE